MNDTELFIDDHESLDCLVRATSEEPIVSLDTEFVRERTYYPQLCLIQIATPTLAACVDCLAELDLKPLFECLLAPERTWLLHSARQDLEVLQQRTGGLPTRLIDTQIAAGLLGLPPQIGLQDLVDELLGVQIDKGYARTNWAKRPLPEAAVDYALDDVRHLSRLWQALRERLEGRERLHWLEEDCRLALVTPLVTPPVTIWQRLKRLGSLDAGAKCAALALVEWREKCAQELDRPRRWVLSDELLVRIAVTGPETREELAAIAEMPKRLAARFGDAILAAAACRGGSERISLVEEHADKPRPDKNGLKSLQDGARQRADELDIHPEVLATRKELIELLLGTASGRVVGGWRWKELKDLT